MNDQLLITRFSPDATQVFKLRDSDVGRPLEDIAHVLVLEPRHYGALAGMGFILEKSDRPKEALRVFRKVLEIYPQQEDIRKVVERLVPEVDGRDL